MSWGLKNRLSKIIKPKTGKTVMLAVDHGYFLGPTTGLKKPVETISALQQYADALMLTRGVLRASVSDKIEVPIVLRVSGGTSVLTELSNEGLTCAMEDALRLNASAVALSIFVGAQYERQTLLNLAKLVDEGEQCGMPVLAVTAVGKDMGRDARYLGLACRIAAELGAHFVKTYYCKDFSQIVDSCPVPIVVAGGTKVSEKEALELAYNAISEGAVGVDMGRNIFQSDYPVAMIKAVRSIVHDGFNVNEALDLFEKGKKEKQKKFD
ncbi:MAG: 3-hydroxy-5-phosphonooxypentane-2,4-dione thiolase [Candidatus Diapherotrites archaeon CG08_land_8_20_14_0_20_34_12]|nr:MAG: 3-hydroxy-5-phosphonooxypentane-2,4-dione thiolase [Candidatus Diapherotrites archaeon CG08_land_8_20_14_0_20_34_12]